MRLTIFWRLISGYAFILILFVGLSSFSIIQLGRISSTARDALDIDNHMIIYQEKLTDIFLSEVRYAGKYIITHTDSLREQALQFKGDFLRYLAEIKLQTPAPDLKAQLSRVEELHVRYHELFDQEVRYVKAGQIYAESRFQGEKEKVLDSVLAELDRLKRQLQQNLQDKLEAMEKAGRVARTIAEVTTLILFGLCIALSFVISRGITIPLSKLKRLTIEPTEEKFTLSSDLARIPEIQELSEALHSAHRKLQTVAVSNAHFVGSITEQFTIPLISLKNRLDYLNDELADKVTAHQKITFQVLTLETERLIERFAQLHSGSAPDANQHPGPSEFRNTVPNTSELRSRASSLRISLMTRAKAGAGTASNPLAIPWNAISQSIKILASGKARKQ